MIGRYPVPVGTVIDCFLFFLWWAVSSSAFYMLDVTLANSEAIRRMQLAEQPNSKPFNQVIRIWDFVWIRSFLDPYPEFFGSGSGIFWTRIRNFWIRIRNFLDPDSKFSRSGSGIFWIRIYVSFRIRIWINTSKLTNSFEMLIPIGRYLPYSITCGIC